MAKALWRIVLIGLFSAISYGLAGADEGRKLPKIGELFSANPSVYKPYDEAFRDGMRSLGYVDGKNVIFLPRYAQGDYTQFPRLVSELIAADVDVLVVSIAAVQVAMQATRTIPIVAPTMADPIRDGLVASMAHPGGNLTGGSGLTLDSKRLQFAMEIVPGLKRIGLLYEATNPQFSNGADANRTLAGGLGLSLRTYGVHNLDEIRSAFARFEKDRLQVLIVWPTPLLLLHRQSILDMASHKLPVIGEGPEFAEAGAIITYSANYIEMWRHAAVQVDKILKGARAGDLPIEQPTKFALRVNLKTARDLRITIPESILLQADEIIR
jgi:putative ABC transport system substrate-binding protein